MRSLYEIADAKETTVGELTGTRRKYSRIKLPEQLARLVGQDFVEIEHFDEGISANEIPYWGAYYQIKAREQKKGR